MIKLIIFDFDDTLIDNKILDFQSFKQISIKLDGYVPNITEITKLREKNFLARTIIKWLFKKSRRKYNTKKFWEERVKFLESKNSLKYISLRPYSKILLRKLKKHNITIVICTLRKNKKNLELFLDKETIKPFIDSIFNLKDKTIETRNLSNAIKIKQELFNLIMKSYNFNSNEILSIGDSYADYEAARRNKIYHIILKTNNNLSKNSKTNIFTFKELNSKFESIINLNFITKKNK